MNFLKLEGCGNSFIITDSQSQTFVNPAQISRLVCDRNYGVGADGFFLVAPVDLSNFDSPIEVQMFNPDGSLMGMCGNGIRCVCRYLFLRELVPLSQKVINFFVEGRLISCEIEEQGRMVRVAMGHPSFDPATVPINSDAEVINGVLTVKENDFVFSAVSMGNPHCVIFVPDLEKIDLALLGPMIEHDKFFPKRTNVEFVEVIDVSSLRVKVWERGVGLTLACGTGACAVVAAAVKRGFCEHVVKVELPGGVLDVSWDVESDQIYLEGPAREVCAGTWLGD